MKILITSTATREAQAYWSGQRIPSPVDLPGPGIKPGFPTQQADVVLYQLSSQGKSLISNICVTELFQTLLCKLSKKSPFYSELLQKDKQCIIQKLYKRKLSLYFCSCNNAQLLQMLLYFYFKESRFFFSPAMNCLKPRVNCLQIKFYFKCLRHTCYLEASYGDFAHTVS